MSKLLEKVRALVQEHASEIKKDWAPYNSDHEASSVLREEIDDRLRYFRANFRYGGKFLGG